ncbi:P-loop-containing protein [Streptomyces sp. CS014]|uniref:P-loop-containing protein n=1 Tax=Streptomyces sp. CS014 TaxID=2162707 RepID=UPI000D51EB2A|nr:P-loop-containing protein [Streptomyces sp. CS014]PVD04486.1 hypothetical protein DBP12_03410 [Streptomyces sp. CS014]
MKYKALLLVGPPGVGKSTLMQAVAAHAGWTPHPRPTEKVPHVLWVNPKTVDLEAIEMGVLRPGHPGTDALRMDISNAAKRWMNTLPAPLVLLDGARLATQPFVLAAHGSGYRPVVVHLDAPQEVLDQRCAQRGSKQNQAWRKGAATRAKNLHTWADGTGYCTTLRLDATQPPATLAARVWEALA